MEAILIQTTTLREVEDWKFKDSLGYIVKSVSKISEEVGKVCFIGFLRTEALNISS